MTRPINPKKLLHSKWTATNPLRKEKHFIVIELHTNEDEVIQECTLEAVINHNQYVINWRDLKDGHQWRQGWQ